VPIIVTEELWTFEGVQMACSAHRSALRVMAFVPLNGNETASVGLWSEFLAANPEVRVRFPALPLFLSSTGSGSGSTQPL
jgi:hypothetical protein